MFVLLAGTARAQVPLTDASSLAAELLAAQRALDEASADKARAEAELATLVSQRAGAQQRLRERVNALYRLSRAGSLPLSGGLAALLRHRARVERLERIVARDATAVANLRRRSDALRHEAVRLTSRVESETARVDALRERERRLAATPSPFATAAGEPAPLWGGLAPIEPFESQLGRLAMPIAGSARIVDAEREGGSGLELSVAPGVRALAVASGRVAYADRHPAYGLLVILDHGGGYFTVYGGLAELGTRLGAQVARESTIGTAGSAPVFFQVRRGTRPVEARRWLGL